MTKETRIENKTLICSLLGKICSLEDYTSLRNLSSEMKQDTDRLIIDLSRVTFTSSEGLGVIVYVYKACQRENIPLFLFSPRGVILEAIELAGIDMFIPVINSEEELQKIIHTNQ